MQGIKIVEPKDIEKRSFEIIKEEMGIVHIDPEIEPIVMRVVHTSADFDYLRNMCFSPKAVKKGREAIADGATIVTDTNMAMSGINKAAAARHGVSVRCFIADEDVSEEAAERGETRATVSMERAAQLKGPLIFAIGNAPTALIRLYEMITAGTLNPELIIGVPVGFVNVVEAKELIMSLPDTEYIVSRGRKGGSNVAAAICNALLYELGR